MFSESACQVSHRWDDVVSFYACLCELCTWSVANLAMDQRKEQRVCIRFCANLGKSATETLEMIQQGFGDQSLSRTQVFQWHARFKAGRTSVDNDEHTGRPTSWTTPETIARIQEIIRQDRRRIIRDIAEEVDIGHGTCQRVLMEELGMQRVAAKFVPRILMADQIQQRVSVCTELRQLASDDETFLSRVITSSQWKSPTSPRPKKARRVKSNLKSMWIPGSTAKFCGDCVKKYEDIVPNFGENRPGCFTMTRTSSHCRPHPTVSGCKQNSCYPQPTVLPWFGALWLLIS